MSHKINHSELGAALDSLRNCVTCEGCGHEKTIISGEWIHSHTNMALCVYEEVEKFHNVVLGGEL